MPQTRLPIAIEDKICDVADELFASTLRHYLGFAGDKHMRDAFLDSLKGSDVDVHQDIAETEPCEVVVRASGTLANGSHIRNLNIMLLDPDWSTSSDTSRAIANRVIEVWDDISLIAKAQASR